MYAPRLNPREVQDIAKRTGDDRIVFWTSIAMLGFLGAMTVTETAKLVFDLVRHGERGRLGQREQHHQRGRGR